MEAIETEADSEARMNFISDWGPNQTHKIILLALALIFIGFRIGLGILHLIALLYG